MKRGVANFFILVYLVSQNINAGSSQSTQTQAASSATSQTRASSPQSSSPSLTQSSSSTNSISSQPQVVLLNNEQAKLIRPTISPNTTPNLQYVYFVDQNGNNPGINGQSINTQGGSNQPQQCNTVNYPLKTDLTALTPVVVPKNVGPCPSRLNAKTPYLRIADHADESTVHAHTMATGSTYVPGHWTRELPRWSHYRDSTPILFDSGVSLSVPTEK
ncbi:unnamed protein product [Plutella xylostella]|uniref:(diamondback moth) hypothetical protein n=1 Tax=Plutella xylostella TaxID=51655 RepID=A0A8S4G488_PLUXY|nr:unnamed protein product [Plutella xylostella]